MKRSTAAVLVLLTLTAWLGPALAPHDPVEQFDPVRLAHQPPGFELYGPDGPRFVLGSDALGRDVLSRTLHGARTSLTVAILTLALTVTIGLVVGTAAGLAGGWVDAVLMRGVDAMMAFPRLFLVLLVAVVAPPSRWLVVLVLGATGWMFAARLVRAQVQKIKQYEYVEAARTSGASSWTLWRRHVLPGVAAPLGIEASLKIGDIILLESALSYLGIGVPPPTPSWGGMIADAAPHFSTAWWSLMVPALAIVLTVLLLNLVGSAARGPAVEDARLNSARLRTD